MDKDIIYTAEAGTLNDLNQLEMLYDNLNDYLDMTTNFCGWIKGFYPNRETAETAIHENCLFVLKANNDIVAAIILNHKQRKIYNQVKWGISANADEVVVVHTLAIDPKFMKLGVATKLMNFAKSYAMQQNAKAIRLEVALQNIPAIALYEKCGYKHMATVDLGLPYENLKWFKLYELDCHNI